MWRHCRDMEIPDRLAYKLSHFRRHGTLVSDERELFTNPSWIAVYLGQGVVPERAPAATYLERGVPAAERLSSLRRSMAEAVSAMPSHEAFIARAGMASREAVAA